MLLSWASKRNASGLDFTSNVRGATIMGRSSVLSTRYIVLVVVSSFVNFDLVYQPSRVAVVRLTRRACMSKTTAP